VIRSFRFFADKCNEAPLFAESAYVHVSPRAAGPWRAVNVIYNGEAALLRAQPFDRGSGNLFASAVM
jgi:hypothetical protein